MSVKPVVDNNQNVRLINFISYAICMQWEFPFIALYKTHQNLYFKFKVLTYIKIVLMLLVLMNREHTKKSLICCFNDFSVNVNRV